MWKKMDDAPDCFGKDFRKDEEKCMNCIMRYYNPCARAYAIAHNLCLDCLKVIYRKFEIPATIKIYKDVEFGLCDACAEFAILYSMYEGDIHSMKRHRETIQTEGLNE